VGSHQRLGSGHGSVSLRRDIELSLLSVKRCGKIGCMKLFFKRLGQLFEVVATSISGGDVDAVLLRQSDDQPLGRLARGRELSG